MIERGSNGLNELRPFQIKIPRMMSFEGFLLNRKDKKFICRLLLLPSREPIHRFHAMLFLKQFVLLIFY